MLFLKACPRCRGDLVIEREEFARMATCLQCGYSSDLRTLRRTLAAPMVVGAREATRENCGGGPGGSSPTAVSGGRRRFDGAAVRGSPLE